MKFNEYFKVYDNYSFVQKKVATKLCDFVEEKKVKSLFEIGCGTGIFTKLYKEKLNIEKLILNDIFDVRGNISDIDYDEILIGDVEIMELPKSDMIVSSSVFQWIKDLDALLKKISEKTEEVIFSIYVYDNLIEIKNHFGVSLDYHTTAEVKELVSKYYKDVEFFEEEIILEFEDARAALKHLKYTGVTGIAAKMPLTKIRTFDSKFLTYKVAYFKCRNI